jgi:LPS-assembly protein
MAGGRPMSLLKRIITLSMILLLLPAASFGEEDAVMTADTLEQIGPVWVGKGNVSIESKGSVLKAGSVRYDTATKEAVAEGDVYFEDAKTKITASKAELNLEKETGVLYDTEVLFKEQSYRVLGTKIEKRGPQSYFLESGTFTTCTGPVPDWCVKGQEVDLEIGNRIKVKNATFRVRNLPLLYMPYFWAPVVVERRTGFLFPQTGYSSRKGFTWRQPFFWAISENRDATLFTDLYTKRGLGFGAEYRYIETPGVKGSMNFFHIRDNELDRSFREFRAEHRHRWRGLRGFYDISYVNQKDFYREYEPYLIQSSKRFLESQAEVSLRTSRARFYADARYVRELKDGEDQKLVVQKLPEAGVFVRPLALGPVVLTAETSAANFETGRGTDGQRLDAGITLRNALGRGPTLEQSLALGYSSYSLSGLPPGAEDEPGRGHVSYTAELRTSFARQYSNVEHIVLPALSYNYSDFERVAVPLLDSTELLDDVSALELSITNRLRDDKGEFLTLRVSEAYDFRADHDNLGPIKLDLNFNRTVSLALGLSYEVHERIITESRSNFGLKHKRVAISGGHTFTKGGITMYNLALAYKATKALTLKSGAWYDPSGGNLERLNLGLIYDSQCWALALDYTKRPDEHIMFLTFTLKGLGDIIRI